VFVFYTKKRVLKGKIPSNVAIILDGNGRWAKKRGLPRNVGHYMGAKNLVSLVKECDSLGIKSLIVYAFSTENWKRPKNEVDYLMNESVLEIDKNIDSIDKGNIKINFIGRKDRIYSNTLKMMELLENITENKTGLNLIVCFDYGGRYELTEACKKICSKVLNKKINISDINEDLISKNLYSSINEVDLLIRTSGEQRLSNFLLWQVSYSEMYFTKVHFPSFNKKELYKALISFQNRKRRFGGLKE
jgi:undecaprenyl diphosphate synthase